MEWFKHSMLLNTVIRLTVLYINCAKMYSGTVCARTCKSSLRCSPDSIAGFRGLTFEGMERRESTKEEGGRALGRKGKGKKGSFVRLRFRKLPLFLVPCFLVEVEHSIVAIDCISTLKDGDGCRHKRDHSGIALRTNRCHLTCSICS